MYPVKLIVLLPENKPPFVGVVFSDTIELKKLYQDLVLNHKYAGYRLVFEHLNNTINLSLISEKALVVKFYSKLKYDKDKLDAWYYLTKQTKLINFSHLTETDGKLEVVRTYDKDKLFVLPIQIYSVLRQQKGEYLKTIVSDGKNTDWGNRKR